MISLNSSQAIKLLIVDDSAFMRKLISDFFTGTPTIEVVGTARNGKDALNKIRELQPDVVTLDVEMPEMNGLEALKQIMLQCPVPVIMLSSTTLSGAEHTFAAMEYGAVDFVAKPSGTISLDLHKIKDELISKVEQAAKVPVSKLRKSTRINNTIHVSRETEKIGKLEHEPLVPLSRRHLQKNTKKMVLIGTSTGGPRALQEVLTQIPKRIQAPILIVQHMPAGFTKSLANRLDQISEIRVKEAEQGDILENGVAYIAPGGYHMKVQKVGSSYEIVLDQTEPPRGGHRPSVDVLFEDNSMHNDFDKIAVIMTGMGADGSKGLVKMKAKGNVVAIAESANTCIVYGMPKAAVETKQVDEVANLDDIAKLIMKYLP